MDLLALESKFPRVGFLHASEDLHQRAFAGAVFADHGQHFAGLKMKIDLPQGLDTGKSLGNSANFEQCRRGPGYGTGVH